MQNPIYESVKIDLDLDPDVLGETRESEFPSLRDWARRRAAEWQAASR